MWITWGKLEYYFGAHGAVTTGWATIDGGRFSFHNNDALIR